MNVELGGQRQGLGRTHCLLDSCLEVLLDALSIEDMPAFGLNSVFCELVAESADGALAGVILYEHPCVVLAAKDKIRMTCHLAHTCETICSGERS